MDFTSATFPNFQFNLSLFPLTTPSSSTEDVEQIRAKLAQLMHTYPDNLTFINAKYIASLMHINIGVSRALLNSRPGVQMKTQTLANEIIYHLYPTHSIKESFEKYGLKNAERAVFAVIYNTNGSRKLIEELKKQIMEALGNTEALEEIGDLARHVEFQDMDKILKIFEVKEIEKAVGENGTLNSIYSKLALKNI